MVLCSILIQFDVALCASLDFMLTVFNVSLQVLLEHLRFTAIVATHDGGVLTLNSMLSQVNILECLSAPLLTVLTFD